MNCGFFNLKHIFDIVSIFVTVKKTKKKDLPNQNISFAMLTTISRIILESTFEISKGSWR